MLLGVGVGADWGRGHPRGLVCGGLRLHFGSGFRLASFLVFVLVFGPACVVRPWAHRQVEVVQCLAVLFFAYPARGPAHPRYVVYHVGCPQLYCCGDSVDPCGLEDGRVLPDVPWEHKRSMVVANAPCQRDHGPPCCACWGLEDERVAADVCG